jgi:multiple sugar transport system permease protein
MKDFRFVPAVEHVSFYVGIWLVSLIVLVTFFSLLVHSIGVSRVRTSLRTIYYLPGALAGASSVMLWLFLLDPTASPANFLLRAMGMDSFNQVVVPSHMPLIFAIIAFWAGAGGWIVIMYGALNNISQEIMEAARIDGAGPLQLALRIQIPMIRKWIAYMVIMSVAAGVQLFVEPQFLSQATQAAIPNDYSLNQLAYQYAFKQNDFHGASAISLLLLVVALSLSAIFVARGGLFDKE